MAKFSSPQDEYVYTLTLDGTMDAQEGNATGCGEWAALMLELNYEEDLAKDLPGRSAIIREDSQGFVEVEWFDTMWQAKATWREQVEPFHNSHACSEDDDGSDTV